MRKYLLAIVFVLLTAIFFGGCTPENPATASPSPAASTLPDSTPSSAPEETTPASSASPGDSSDSTVSQLQPDTAYELDWDGDGQDETLKVTAANLDTPTLLYKDDGRSTTVQVPSDNFTLSHLYFYTTEEGASYLILSGDLASSDYGTYLCRYNDFIPFFFSEVIRGDAVSLDGQNGTVLLEDAVDVLGTWLAQRTYTLDTESFTLVPAEDVWTIQSTSDSAPVVTTKDLPVELLENGTYQAATLPPGTALLPTTTDEETFVTFRIPEDGREGRISFERRDYMIYIDGEEDSSWFETLNYAG